MVLAASRKTTDLETKTQKYGASDKQIESR